MMFLKVVGFVIASILACAILPMLAVQYPIVFVVIVSVGIFLFSRSFANRKKYA